MLLYLACALKTSGLIFAREAIFLADPTVFYDKGTYYLYGTGGSRDGFQVYTSANLKDWKGPAGINDGYALVKGESYGTHGFWAPQVFKHQGKYYMAYTADENIAIATSDSPMGPFKQTTLKALSATGHKIDPFVFIDGDGKIYLYHVRLDKGNRLFVTEMEHDLSGLKEATTQLCFEASAAWENTVNSSWPVTEGPTVLKYQQKYYLFYSANDFRNVDYAVGYAVAPTPYGPWEKYSGNPIISKHNLPAQGTGHGDFIKGPKGALFYVLHTHADNSKVSPRRTAMVKAGFVKGNRTDYTMRIDTASFYYLTVNKDN